MKPVVVSRVGIKELILTRSGVIRGLAGFLTRINSFFFDVEIKEENDPLAALLPLVITLFLSG